MLQCVIIFSGGMDSTTLLLHAKKQGYDVWGLSFYYGQKHAKELDYARYWGEKECKEWKMIDISFLRELANTSSLITPTISIPHDHYTHDNQRSTVVPNRNMLMLSIAIAWAENLKISQVWFGPHSNDTAVYPDCRPEFIAAMNTTSQLATYQHVEVLAPFATMSKGQIAKLGNDLGLDFAKTWSCYEGGQYHCGKCGTCQERHEAFIRAQMADPTQYE